MKKLLIVMLPFNVISLNIHAQEIVRNLGFEQIDPKGQILSWTPGNTKQQYITRLDTLNYHSGKCSFLIESIPNAGPELGVGGAENIIFSPLLKSTKTVKISGYIKTENITDGFAGMAIRLNGDISTIAQADSGNGSKTGTNDWSLIEVELPLTPEVVSVSFAIQNAGRGRAWFDDIQISVDDKVIASSTYEDKVNLNN